MKRLMFIELALPNVVYSLFWIFTLCSTTAIAVGAEAGDPAAQYLVAGARRPVSVPEGYLITPFGYFHPSCVQSLSVGESMLPDGRLQHADGSVAPTVAICDYPHYTPTGLLFGALETSRSGQHTANAEGLPPPEVSGWLENANVTTGTAIKSYGAMVTTWTVPADPAADDGQVLFFFPGFEDIGDSATSILQPVLTWASKQWTITSWNCCLSGIVTSSPSVNVAPGDKIFGSVTSTCASGTLTCQTWNVLSVDLTTGKSTILANTPSDAQVFNWAFGAVAEPYYVISCNDFPTGGGLTFSGITLFNQNLEAVAKPAWSKAIDTSATPTCKYGVTDSATSVTVDF